MMARLVFFILLLIGTGVGHASPLAVVNTLESPFDLAPYIEYLEDTDRSLTYDDLVSSEQHANRWVRNTRPVFKGEHTNSRYWFRVQIQLDVPVTPRALILHVDNQPGLIDNLHLRIPSASAPAGYTHVHTGFLHPFESRAIDTTGYNLHLPIQSEPFTLIGWTDNKQSGVPAQLPLFLLSNEQFLETNKWAQGIMVAFYAIMLSAFVYNFCLFLLLRQPVYGFYLLFVSTAIYSGAYFDGSTLKWLFPNNPSLNIRLGLIDSSLTLFFYALFVWHALDHIRFSARLAKGFKLIFVMGGITVLTIALVESLAVANIVMQLYSALVMPIASTTLVVATIKRIPTAFYFLIAEVFVVSGVICFSLMANGFIEFNRIILWSLHLGFTWEVLLLSFALAARTRLAQQAAIAHLEMYHDIYDKSVEGRFQYNYRTRVFTSNNAFCAIVNQPNNATPAANPAQFSYFPIPMSASLVDILETHGVVNDYEIEIPHHDDTPSLWLAVTMQIEKDSTGKPQSSEGLVIDISERKSREAEEKKRIAAESSNEAKMQFFASMSHEFRTPLTAILGYSQIALAKDTDPQTQRQHIRIIDNSARHMLALINDVLDLSKIESQKLELENIQFNLPSLCHDVIDFIWILASEKNIQLDLDFVHPLPTIITSDPTRLKQALINLCSNSVKFTHEGRVSMQVAFDMQTESLSFAIQDTGIGLKDEQKDRLFNAFTQADSSTSRNFGGTGLGLHLSRLIANALGGDISVDSVYGSGSTFTLHIHPALSSDTEWTHEDDTLRLSHGTANTPTFSHSPENKVPTINVLVAEDNEVNQQLIGFHLRRLGANVITAHNGIEAIGQSLTNDIDIILMDMDMPLMDGLSAVRHLRSFNISTPIFALTGNTSEDDIRQCKHAGCNGHLAKPIDIPQLEAAILAAK